MRIGKKNGPLVPVGNTNRDKRVRQAHVALAAPFVLVGVTNRDKRVLFVPVARPGTKGHPLL